MFINIVILGATGDLAKKKIIPSCLELISNTDYSIKVYPWSRKEFVDTDLFLSLQDSDSLGQLIVGDYNSKEILSEFLEANKNKKNIFYLSLPPIANIGFLQMISELHYTNYELIIEKPYAQNFEDFKKIDEIIYRSRMEKRVNFLDHYLFKDTLQFNKTLEVIFEKSIKKPPKTFRIELLESIDIQDRIEYYDTNGCIKDMFFHLYSIYLLMTKKLNFQQDLTPIYLVKGQYKDYQKNLNKDSQTETAFHAILKSKDYIVSFDTGKKLDEKISKVEIAFSDNSILTWNIHPTGVVEFYNSSITAHSLPKVHSDHFNIFCSLINNDKSKFLTPQEVKSGWMMLEKLQRTDSELNLY
ncbi:MAG: hypothetical protein ACRCXZ_03420 [Patescibacteria group bacterium]